MTTSTPVIETTLRNRLLTFTPLTGPMLVDQLGVTVGGSGADGRLYWRRAPDLIDKSTPPVRYGVLSLKNRRRDAEQAERAICDFEVMLFARPDEQRADLEVAADICDQAMLRYTDGASGVLGTWGGTRNPMPPFVSPADRDVVQIQLVYTLVLWAAYLTQYHDS